MKRFNTILPNVGRCWLYVVVFLLGSLVMGLVLAPLVQLIKPVQMSVLYLASFVPVFALLMFESKPKFSEVFEPGQSVPIHDPHYGSLSPVVLYLLLIVSTIATGVLMEPLVGWMEMPEYLEKLFESLMGGDSADTLISVCILAPLCEEFFCRGILLRGMLQHTTPARAILWSGLIFAVMHANPFQGIPAFLLGCLMGWVYYRTRSLWATITIHCVNNSISSLLTVLYPDLEMNSGYRDIIPGQWYLPVLAASAIITALTILLLARKLPHVKYEKEETVPDNI